MIVNIARLLKLLEWSGVHARTLLPVGVIVAFFMPESGTFFKPAAPYILALLVSVAMLTAGILAVLKDAVQPRRLVRNICLALVLLIVTPYCLHSIATVAGFEEVFANIDHLVRGITAHWHHHLDVCFSWFFCANSNGNCLLTNLLAPFTGPFMGEMLLGAAVPLSVMTLSLRLGAILFGGILLAVLAKWWLGDERITPIAAVLMA